jgi:hypothetical protein
VEWVLAHDSRPKMPVSIDHQQSSINDLALRGGSNQRFTGPLERGIAFGGAEFAAGARFCQVIREGARSGVGVEGGERLSPLRHGFRFA